MVVDGDGLVGHLLLTFLCELRLVGAGNDAGRFGCFGGVITTVGMETLGWYRYEGCMNDSEVPNGNSKLAKITLPKSDSS